MIDSSPRFKFFLHITFGFPKFIKEDIFPPHLIKYQKNQWMIKK